MVVARLKVARKMKQNLKNIVSIIFCGSIALNCTSFKPDNHALREGDILFQNLKCGELCEAISEVTHGINGRDFSHCALVVEINDTLKVIEAIGEKVQINSLEDFFSRDEDVASKKGSIVGRLKPEYDSLIGKVVLNAKNLLGQPYDDAFLLDNEKWYCSELIYEAFKIASNGNEFFPLEPMTFKSPKTQTFFPAWVDYYKSLGLEIPEGKPGTNPGLISRSEKLEIFEYNGNNN